MLMKANSQRQTRDGRKIIITVSVSNDVTRYQHQHQVITVTYRSVFIILIIAVHSDDIDCQSSIFWGSKKWGGTEAYVRFLGGRQSTYLGDLPQALGGYVAGDCINC